MKKVFYLLFVLNFISVSAFAVLIPPPAGQFDLPFDENQTWTDCGSIGWKPRTQYHMEYYSEKGKYHMGEDWNGICGGNTDEGAPLLAIASGKVVFLDNIGTVSGQGRRLYIRHSFPYAPTTNDVMVFDSAYLHLQGMASGITWDPGVPSSGSVVSMGQTVAYLGKTGTDYAHLHWEAQTDLSIPLGTNPYQYPLMIDHALKYRAPSLIVNDRQDVRGYSVPQPGNWYSFTMQGNAPSSTMYVKRNGERKSLKNAIAAEWIPSEGILHEKNGSWHYYNDVDLNFFEDGSRYAIKSLVSGTIHFIPVPRNDFQDDRARIDMIHAVENDSRFTYVRTDSSGHNPNWSNDFELYWLGFELTSGGVVYANQATDKNNPLERYTTYYDPDLGQWTDWQQVDRNKLY